jgi:hypothetical protein
MARFPSKIDALFGGLLGIAVFNLNDPASTRAMDTELSKRLQDR